MILAVAPPPPPPAEAPVHWIARPSDAEVRDAESYLARVTNRAATARMRCLVRSDGSLDACGFVPPADGDTGLAAAVLALAPRFRVDVGGPNPPTTVTAEVAFPKLVDEDARLVRDSTAEEERAANTQDLRAAVSLHCIVGTDGRLSECHADPAAAANPALCDAALQVAALRRYAPARLDGHATPTKAMVHVYFRSRGDTPPGWLHKPDLSELRAVWPSEAARRGIGGSAYLTCRVTAAGLLTRCTVVRETPTGAGFGGAALALTPTFTMKAATHEGRPVDDEVTIPVNFVGGVPSSQIGESVRMLPWTVWAQTPTLEEVRRAYPAEAAARKVNGSVAFQCQLRRTGELYGCIVAQEFPGGQGFAGAARSLLPRFRAEVGEADAKTVAGVRVQLTIRFSDHSRTPPAPYGLSQVDWVQGPTADLVRATFPKAAVAAHVESGRAVIACVVGEDGMLTGCRTRSAEPPGLGFGPAAETIATALKVNRWTREGEVSAGAEVVLPLRMVNGGGGGDPPAEVPAKPPA